VIVPKARQITATRTNRPTVSENVNLLLKTSPYMKISFASIIGPKTINASLETKGKVTKFAAMNASLVLQRESKNASTIIAAVAKIVREPKKANASRLTAVLKTLATAAPITR
jgi:hypothetical protein